MINDEVRVIKFLNGDIIIGKVEILSISEGGVTSNKLFVKKPIQFVQTIHPETGNPVNVPVAYIEGSDSTSFDINENLVIYNLSASKNVVDTYLRITSGIQMPTPNDVNEVNKSKILEGV